ncbi:MAG: FTR1 family protein [Proteobacteria bacterium]|nr:FTR1 family protein [Pseudomonadota bacterium]
MLASAIITFREVFEAALVVIIVLAYLKRTGKLSYVKAVWTGVGLGVLCSVLLAVVVESVMGGLTGPSEKIVEGVMMLTAVLFITWMVVWIFSTRNLSNEIAQKAERATELGSSGAWGAAGIVLLISMAVMREGFETAIFLNAASSTGGASLSGALTGVALALILSYSVFKGSRLVNIKTFFRVTTAMLVLFAAGLFSHALLEFQQAGLISPVIDHIYDISWLMNKSSTTGSLLNSLFGYTGRPSLVEMGGYLGYLTVTYLLYVAMRRSYRTGRTGAGNSACS